MTLLLPREHGAYAQVAVPLVTAFAATGVSRGGALLATAVIAGFLAHEPAAVLLGLRGARLRQSEWHAAVVGLAVFLTLTALLGALGVLHLSELQRWTLIVPAAPAFFVAIRTARGDDRSVGAQVATGLAFAGAAMPVAIAAGASVAQALAISVPFAYQFTSATLAVRSVILKVRGGGDPVAAAASRRTAITLAAAGVLVASALAVARLVTSHALLAVLPGAVAATGLALFPPHPTRLRIVGWTLVAVSVSTALIVIAGA